MPEFSPKQRQIIENRGNNILVSAAAGSGKTTVLVQRIIERILDKDDPINIDEILVLTFTKAAAAEMRERIATALTKELEDNPDNEHLQKQTALIFNAQITTIDSFCLSVLKNNFTEIGLEPGFRSASEAEMKFLTDDILEECIEEILRDKTIPYLDELLARFQSRDSLKKLKEVILMSYKAADNAPFVNDYLDARSLDYDVESVEDLESKEWFKNYRFNITRDIEYAINSAKELIDECQTLGPDEYIGRLEADIELFERLKKCDFTGLLDICRSSLDWGKVPSKVKCDTEQKDKVKGKRDLYKDLINGIAKDLGGQNVDSILLQMVSLSRVTKALMEATRYFYNRLEEEKRKRGLITFSDMEHLALQILLKKEGGVYVPTQVAKDYRECYRELMIDEYQDSNYIQEALIHSISGEDEGRYDRFIVGDIKQSIYRFRNANPELFMEKYDAYAEDQGPLCRIDLSMNYRSRASVLDPVNVVFERVMDREIGGVDYDNNQRLYLGANYPEACVDTKAELLIVKPDDTGEYGKEELESLLIAKRIKNLVSSYKVFDKEKGCMRPCDYRDIVILVRSTGDFTDELKATLNDQDIPAYVTSKSGYFNSIEIVTLLNYIRVLNNPYNDIPLFGSLKAVFGGFNDDEIAILKIIGRDNIYLALRKLAEDDLQSIKEEMPLLEEINLTTIKDKATSFINNLNRYRGLVPYTPIHELLRMILNEYGYINYMAAMPMGEQRKANVIMLLNKAESFENDGFKGLFNFTRYIEKLRKYESDEGEVVTLDENANVVRIMTMHKSKGLEFPVCILANLSKGSNKMDENKDVLYHSKYGIGMNYIDAKRRVKCQDIRRRFISSMIKKDSLSEELRILYVAMTRAKEKLIMTAVSEELEEGANPDNGCMAPYDKRKKLDSFLDVLKVSRFEDDWNGQIDLSYYTLDDIANAELTERVNRAELYNDIIHVVKTDDCKHSEELENIKRKLEFEYSHKNLQNMYVKTSVSELKMAAISDAMVKGSMEDVPAEFFEVHKNTKEYIPSFIREEKEEHAGTAVGSAYHRVLELIDYKTITGRCDLDALMASSIDSGAITLDEYDLVNKSKVENFLDSDLAKRMMAADSRGELYKEQPFVLGIAANRLSTEFPEEEQVLIQGIIDVYFIEKGEIVLMDYKTDRINTKEELTKRYSTQLNYYEEALSRITGLRVKERLIYSFALNETIKC